MESPNTEESTVIKSPLVAVRKKCLECMENSAKRVKECECSDCPTFHLRLGKNPFRRSRVVSEDEKKKLSIRSKEMWRKKNGV